MPTAASRTPPTIHLLRHGQSEANVQGLIASSPAAAGNALGLTAVGREQVRRSVIDATAAGTLPIPCRVITSPLLRARESADIAAALLGAAIDVDPRLTERGFGELELGSDALYQQVWSADREDSGHERWGVESVAALSTRVAALIRELRERGDAQTFVLCTHGDVASVLLCAAQGFPLADHRSVGAMANGELRPVFAG